jgi:hypothetical protein
MGFDDRPLPRGSIAMAVTACAIVVVLALAGMAVLRPLPPEPAPLSERPPVVERSTFAEQRSLLSVLRERTAADADPQVALETEEWTRSGTPVRADYARLLGKAPKSGKAFVLLSVPHYNGRLPGDPMKPIDNAVCLTRRGTEGGAGSCVSTPDFRRRGISSVLAGQVYGVVPDQVVAVRPQPGARPVPVRRNFYAYPVALRDASVVPTWLDAHGRTIGPNA